ncbi:MAG: peroxide stress protein YaaA, partial [Propionibacteriales bacterium]|nr:peroxide stress protein YaaA [Propionibacteriales bacterium]
MLIVLPPSESKTPAQTGKSMDHTSLSLPELTEARAQVAAALATTSRRAEAFEILKVSTNLGDEVRRNTVLDTAPATSAARLYSGVLFDALDLPSVDTASRRRATRQIRIVSALYGVVRLTDKVAP